ncbi:hypothetical protein ACQP1W_27995 [Spirillospora sp. CA-255316]
MKGSGDATAHPGGYANTGTHIGDVLLAPPAARSAYLQRVRDICPPEIEGRESELAELGAFCSAEGAGRWAWWQGPAWSGKSALMAWLALRPPPGVRVVSFFITSRWKGQNDRAAFVNVMLEQLAEVAGQPVPAFLPEATREVHLLDLLERAAGACQEAGRRLVLVVDGLDEDRGNTAAPDAHSIAALLPRRLPEGVRVVVTSRPHPPVPFDVDDQHPLRDPGVIRRLAPSPVAKVIRSEALRELAYLLRGSVEDRDMLGLVAAAGGGLSAADLAELTGRDAIDVEEQLSTAPGRTFSSRTSLWAPESVDRVYIVAHEELQRIAVQRLGPDRLARYRERLHAWAEGYRDQGWPGRTPEYLLRGYFSLLHSVGDISRMVACCLDGTRRDRMLDITGGDHAALLEITTVQDAICDQDPPDLAAMLRIAIARDTMYERNNDICIELPAAWASAGNINRAEALARTITDTHTRARALAKLAAAVATSGDHAHARELIDQAQHTAGLPTRATVWPEHFAEMAQDAVTAGGDLAWCVSLVDSITDTYKGARATARLAGAVAAAGYRSHARDLADRAQAMATSVKPDWAYEVVSAELARAAVELGDLVRAETLIASPAGADWNEHAVCALVGALGAAGDPDHAEALARSHPRPPVQAQALAALARVLATAGDGARAHRLVDQALTLLDEHLQADQVAGHDVAPWIGRLASIALAAAAAADHDRARDLLLRARSLIPNGSSTVERLAELAAQAAEAAAPDIARDMLAEAEALAHRGRRSRAQEMFEQKWGIELLKAVATAGDLDRAEALARSIDNWQVRDEALATLAEAAATAGDPAAVERAAGSIRGGWRYNRALLDAVRIFLDMDDVDHARALHHLFGDPDLRARSAAETAAAAGDLDQAEALAHSIENLPERTRAWAALAVRARSAGDAPRAHTFIDHGEELARTLESVEDDLLATLVRAVVAMGDLDRAETLARSIRSAVYRATALQHLARAHAGRGDPERAQIVMRQDTDPYVVREMSAPRAGIVAAAGDLDRGEALARAITGGDRDEALVAVAGAAAAAGEMARAESLARSIGMPHLRAEGLVAVAANAPPQTARRYLCKALRASPWTAALPTLAVLSPDALVQTCDDIIADFQQRASRHADTIPWYLFGV